MSQLKQGQTTRATRSPFPALSVPSPLQIIDHRLPRFLLSLACIYAVLPVFPAKAGWVENLRDFLGGQPQRVEGAGAPP